MKVITARKVIEMTKKFAKAAEKFGSDEYNMLQAARKDNPNFKIVVVAKKTTAGNTYKGLTYEYMEKYIKSHDDEKKSIMGEYMILRGLTDEAKDALAESVSYLEMRDWFLNKFPAIAEFHKKRKMIMAA